MVVTVTEVFYYTDNTNYDYFHLLEWDNKSGAYLPNPDTKLTFDSKEKVNKHLAKYDSNAVILKQF